MKCPSCGSEVITTPDGRHLNPQRSRFGRYFADGTQATADDVRHASVRAYFEHICTPVPTQAPTQDALF